MNHQYLENLSTVLTFGKYGGRTVAEVQASDPSYLAWYRSTCLNDGHVAPDTVMSADLHKWVNEWIVSTKQAPNRYRMHIPVATGDIVSVPPAVYMPPVIARMEEEKKAGAALTTEEKIMGETAVTATLTDVGEDPVNARKVAAQQRAKAKREEKKAEMARLAAEQSVRAESYKGEWGGW
jgi:hypothetical protein